MLRPQSDLKPQLGEQRWELLVEKRAIAKLSIPIVSLHIRAVY